MGEVFDVLSRARGDAQALHQKIVAAADRDHDTARSDLQQAGATARQLADLLKVVAESQRNDAPILKECGNSTRRGRRARLGRSPRRAIANRKCT
jgi:hypothetical protein